jgi:LemA protein
MKGLFIGLGILVVIGMLLWGGYNSFVTKSQAVDTQWAQVENVYQRRYDLIPNLVNSVKGAMAQEQKVFDAIAQARTKYGEATTSNDKVDAVNELDSAVSRLLVIMENYPQLKSIDTVSQFMAELAGTENRISVERRRFNEVTQNYNNSVKTFPGNFFSGMFGFKEKPYFKAVEGADKAPEVKF